MFLSMMRPAYADFQLYFCK